MRNKPLLWNEGDSTSAVALVMTSAERLTRRRQTWRLGADAGSHADASMCGGLMASFVSHAHAVGHGP